MNEKQSLVPKKCYSDGANLEMTPVPDNPPLSRQIESLSLDYAPIVRKDQVYRLYNTSYPQNMLLSKVLNTMSTLIDKKTHIEEDLEDMRSVAANCSNQNCLILVELERERVEKKRLQREIAEKDERIRKYESLLRRYDISDLSLLENMSSQSKTLQDESDAQKKEIYGLQQELYQITRQYETVKKRNESLLQTVKNYHVLSISNEPKQRKRRERESKAGHKRSSFWNWMKTLFSKKKRKKSIGGASQLSPNPLDEASFRAYQSASLKSEVIHSSSSPVLFEDTLKSTTRSQEGHRSQRFSLNTVKKLSSNRRRVPSECSASSLSTRVRNGSKVSHDVRSNERDESELVFEGQKRNYSSDTNSGVAGLEDME